MPVPQQLLINAIRTQCEEIEERYPGYRRELVGYLAEILSIERAAPFNIAQQVRGQLEAFGELYQRKTAESSGQA